MTVPATSSGVAADAPEGSSSPRGWIGPQEDPDRETRRLIWRARAGVGLVAAANNLLGAAAVVALAVWVLPSDPVPDEGGAITLNLILAAAWLPLAVGAGWIWGVRAMRPARAWLLEGRAPTDAEELAVLRSPVRLFRIQVRLWTATAVVFGGVNALLSVRLLSRVGVPILLGGLTTAAVTYLTAERLLRPIAARALAEGHLDRPRLPGVATRQLLVWALGTGVPVLGLVISGIVGAADTSTTRLSLAVTMITVGGVALAIGLWTTYLGARAVADPVRSVRAGLDRVGDGDLDVAIPVYDGSEVGLLQAGFNRMVEGLRERERLRDLFGRHVGEEVVSEALDHDPALGGEVRDVAVLFVDMVGSTRLAAQAPPAAVVEVLNRYFAIVVSVVDAHGGWINKFQGDAALAVFGAPTDVDDHAGRALAAARDLAARLAVELPGRAAGIGVAAGPTVAGNIGAEERFEYTVIGDPVNEAARLTEMAKEVECRVLASGAAVAAAGPTEAELWDELDRVTLRGRTAPTVVFTPR